MVSTLSAGITAERVDSSTLTGKVIMGYQGWFGCPDDGSGRGWRHWKSGTHFTVDMLPDTSELTPEEKCDSGMKTALGEPVYLFSSQNALTVDRHFLWMEQNDLDGVAIQKFATVLGNGKEERAADRVLNNVRSGAEKHGRVFFLMYDLSGLPSDRLDLVVQDWKRLSSGGLTESTSYLHHHGKPLLGLWGLGFKGRDLAPSKIAHMIDDLEASPVSPALLAGVPAHWRTSDGDADPNPEWGRIWPRIQVVSPWTVGRFSDANGAKVYAENILKLDFDARKDQKRDYMPVVYPGFSWVNLMLANGRTSPESLRSISREDGKFFMSQGSSFLEKGVDMIYVAMFDELDESTAIMKTLNGPRRFGSDGSEVTFPAQMPSEVPSDNYLHLVQRLARELRSRVAARPESEKN